MSIRGKLLVLSVIFVMPGCSFVRTAEVPAPVSGIAAVEAELVEAVESAELANASHVEDWRHEVSVLPEGALLPTEAAEPIDVDWNGPIEDLLADLAKRLNYEFAVAGNAPPESVIVEIVARNEPLFGVASRAGYLAPARITVFLDPDAELLELRWIG